MTDADRAGPFATGEAEAEPRGVVASALAAGAVAVAVTGAEAAAEGDELGVLEGEDAVTADGADEPSAGALFAHAALVMTNARTSGSRHERAVVSISLPLSGDE